MPARGFFNDGRTARRHPVTLEIIDDVLTIRADDGAVLARWPLADIRLVDPGSKERIRFRLLDEAPRLTLAADDDGAWLARRCPHLTRPAGRAIRWPRWAAAGVLAAVSLIGIALFVIPAVAGWATALVPHGWESRLGMETRDQLVSVLRRAGDGAWGGTCGRADADAVLQRRADELAATLESPFPIRVTVLSVPVANAFALPGGQVMLLGGLFDAAENGDELMGVLAHEVAHVVRRDPLRVSIERTGAALLASLVVGDVLGGAVLTGTASAILEGGYSRDAEAAADELAVAALNRLGLTARPLADFLERLQARPEGGMEIPEFLSTHPAGPGRAARVRDLAQQHGRAFTRYEWQAIRAMCGG